MNTDYISYYFTPLVSMWYIVIYLTMMVGAQFNDRTPLLLCKILASAAFMTWFMKSSLLDLFFDALHQFGGIRWSSREWSFRVNLDLWIVYVGMLVAIAVIKVREYRLTDHFYWHMVVKASIGISGAVILWFFGFELYQESKYTYNAWHPYISFLPILAFTILRNSNPILRSATSRAFAYIGKCSLETFVIQFHFWLAGDTKGILVVVPGTRWRSINFVVITVMFIYLSDRVAHAATQVTNCICGASSSPARAPLPLPVTAPIPIPEEQVLPLPHNLKDASNPLVEPDIPVRPRRWVDRLADGTPPQKGWSPLGLKSKILLFLSTLWLLNLLWLYPYDSIA
jgi:N-acetylneuraminate 9-O-acetyltransferase